MLEYAKAAVEDIQVRIHVSNRGPETAAVHDIIVVVILQDGNVRFVTWKGGMVTYWDQVATSLLDI